MEFEYNSDKSLSNKEKHSLSFEEAKHLWDDPFAIEIPIYSYEEERYMVIGKINNKLWSAVVTYRNGKTRLISVRRSRKNEEIHDEEN